MKTADEFRMDPRVGVSEIADSTYPSLSGASGEAGTSIDEAIEKLARALGWLDEARGPLGRVIPRGARVLIKPNFVMHENHGPWGIEPLLTHSSIIKAAVEAALRADASEVLVGDAPLQSCDFARLLSATGLDRWADRMVKADTRFIGIHDFRRTTCGFVNGVRVASQDLQSEDRFVLFDMTSESLLEPVTEEQANFRVTCYDPRLMSKTHRPGRHQYLVARDVMDADVVINLPKLKTHKKAGVTCALKNLIGINGNKEYLPHHRVGGAKTGGDCYPGGSRVKRALEYTLDRQNMAESMASGRLWNEVATNLNRLLRLTGDDLGTEGSWSGNDTIWRTCLDLNRILLYGKADRSLGNEPARRVIHIVDAVVAGQGDGPLSPQPLDMGLILAGENAAALDWVGARLLGYWPERIPIIREAFGDFRWPLASFAPDDITLLGDLGTGNEKERIESWKRPAPVIYPAGWRDAAQQST